ncbi:MAG: ribosome small subunit-dependent GTPase A [Flavobacteriales bacterium]
MLRGLVMRSTGSRYRVRGEDGTVHDCVAKGNLRVKGYTSTNPIAVGDRVMFEPVTDTGTANERVGSIVELLDRKNYLVRRSVNLSHHMSVIAANIDQLLLMATVARPRTSFGFIDRFLVTAEAYQVPSILVFNKVDDLDEGEEQLLEEYERVYRVAGYPMLRTSAETGVGVDGVKELLAGKVTLLAGHSGVGKSTLINTIDPLLDLRTNEVSWASDKGQHTTTFAEMFELNTANGHWPMAIGSVSPQPAAGTFIIDTPGVKGFGLVDMSAEEIVDQFPEMLALKSECRFGDCKHMEEPGCAVKRALEDGRVPESRYTSYIDMVHGIDDTGPYRLD